MPDQETLHLAAALDRDLLARAMAYVRDGHDAQWHDYIREADGLLVAIDALRERSGRSRPMTPPTVDPRIVPLTEACGTTYTCVFARDHDGPHSFETFAIEAAIRAERVTPPASETVEAALRAEARAAALPHLEAVARSMREWLAVSGDAPATEHRAAIGAWLASTDAAIDALRERSGE